MLRATFSGFTTAQLAMAASQRALDITGQNLANVNTDGYTRQRLDLISFNSNNGDYYVTNSSARIGNGVIAKGVSQLRDPFLDIQYRRQISNVGAYDSKDSVLSDLAAIFDETNKGSIQTAFQDIDKQLLALSSGDGADNMVRSSMEILLNLIHGNSTELSSVREHMTTDFEDTTQKTVNGILNDIKELNKSIKVSQILGNPALEQMDQRNSKLDELATYLPIDVSYKDFDISKGNSVSVLQVSITTSDGSRISLIDDDKIGEFTASTTNNVTQLNVKDTENASHQLAGVENGAVVNHLGSGTYKGTLDMLNSAGAFNGNISSEKGLGYYEESFDMMVSKFATLLNTLNGADSPDHPDALFSTLDGSTDFTAANIKISDAWKNGTIEIKKSMDPNATSDDKSNINKIQEALKASQDFETADGSKIYKGDFYNFYVNMQAVLGIDQQSTSTVLKNSISVVNQTTKSRLSVSGVNMDEEGVNLMHYQQSYTAACRLMTSLNEVLENLLNVI